LKSYDAGIPSLVFLHESPVVMSPLRFFLSWPPLPKDNLDNSFLQTLNQQSEKKNKAQLGPGGQAKLFLLI
jgi:hypothetical protein